MKVQKEVREVLSKLNYSGYKAYIVGGCVRDSLMNKKPKDWDVTTSANPEQVMKVFNDYKVIPTGIKHGTVTVLVNKNPIEITTFRVDGIYKDYRRPESVSYTNDLRVDLSRRDFTINAMAYNEDEGVVDYFGGIKDIENKLIRCVGESKKRFEEDALRMMRAVRFAAELGFDIEESTYKEIFNLNGNLQKISRERVRDELLKIIKSKYPEKIEILYKTGLLKDILPELSETIKEDRYDKLDETIKIIKNIKNNEDAFKLAGLLNYIGSKYEVTFNPNQFKNTTKKENEYFLNQIEENLIRLRIDNSTIKKVKMLLAYKNFCVSSDKFIIKKLLSEVGINGLYSLLEFRKAFEFEEEKRNLLRADIRLVKEIVKDIVKRKECYSKKDMAINGENLLKLGINEGASVGKILDDLLEYVVLNPEKNNSDELSRYVIGKYLHNNKKNEIPNL